MYDAKVLADSISPSGVRLVTVVVTVPRIILAENNTHRDFSRNTASSRAIPINVRCDAIEANPFVPTAFGKNKRGMQSDELLGEAENAEAQQIWREAVADALKHARRLEKLKTHKQYGNRVTESYAWVTQLISATEWDNYMNLRAHKDAQPEIQIGARLIRAAMLASKPKLLQVGEWHLPLISPEESFSVGDSVKTSVGRCAAVSYEKQAVQKTLPEEIERHGNLLASGHMSPFEHQAKVANEEEILEHGMFSWNRETQAFEPKRIGNFRSPWLQYRKTIPGEAVFNVGVEAEA